jgi:D-glycero-D-manno-heptose 1,7-bisphosphate phosphatase
MSNTAVFFDRDGTLIHDPGYLNHPDQVQVADGAAEALKEFQLLGYKTVVATNQSGVARGIVTVEMLERIHDRLRELLAAKGAALDAIYYCPYHPDGVVPEYCKESDWQKPRPGMLLAAAAEMNIDLTRSWMIGDSDRDVEAGRSAGCKTILISSTHSDPGHRHESKPDFVAVNLREAVNIVKRHHRTVHDRRVTPVPEISDEEALAAKSAEILLMTPEGPPQKVEEKAPTSPGPSTTEPATVPSRTDQILTNILEQLRRMQKNEMFGEFSLMRMIAGIVQVFALFCLLLALWFLLGSRRQDDNVLVALGFAAVLQMTSLTFYLMRDRR